MADSYKKTKEPISPLRLDQLEKMHPYKMLLLVGIFGSIMIFFFLLVAYSASDFVPDKSNSVHIPRAFIISTIVLFASSFTLSRTEEHFRNENSGELKRALLFTLVLGFTFSLSQFVGWNELMLVQEQASQKGSITYLYALSGLHILHMTGGIIYLSYCYIVLIRKLSDPVQSLIYYTNPFRKLQLNLLVTYWHFMDALWMFLFLFFLFLL